MEVQQVPPPQSERKLLGFKGFVRHNPKSDRFISLLFLSIITFLLT